MIGLVWEVLLVSACFIGYEASVLCTAPKRSRFSFIIFSFILMKSQEILQVREMQGRGEGFLFIERYFHI